MNKSKFTIALAISVIGLINGVETAKADSCINDGTIGTIRFQPCDKIAVVVGGRSFNITMEEFTTSAIAKTAVVVAKHNVVVNEIIAKALVEKNQSTFAPSILAYKIPDSMTRNLPTAIAPVWIALK
jgi:hypothetical protein